MLMDLGVSQASGEFFSALNDMGFTEQQIKAAVNAGKSSIPEAAEWLTQVPQPAQPTTIPPSEFKLPQNSQNPVASDSHAGDSGDSQTIGELVATLKEMGFTEQQITSAVQAGKFSVPQAAEWLLQEQKPRLRLTTRTSQTTATALAAFNTPREATHPCTSDNSACPSLAQTPPQHPSTSLDPPPVESRIKPDMSDFRKQQIQCMAQEVKAARRQKQLERDLVLKRIADDRKSRTEIKPCVTNESSSNDQGQKLAGEIQNNRDNNCTLMIRLPSGESMSMHFAADTPLRSVVEHISKQHPSLASFSLLQGFPRKRFGDTDLDCSLLSLGLTPSAALCVQPAPQETPRESTVPVTQLSAEQEEQTADAVPPSTPPLPDQVGLPVEGQQGGLQRFPVQGEPDVHSHSWGRGQKLNAEEDASMDDTIEAERAVENAEETHGQRTLPVQGEPDVHAHSWGRGQKLNAEEDASMDDTMEAEGAVENAEETHHSDDNDNDDVEEEEEDDDDDQDDFSPRNMAQRGKHHWPRQGNRLQDAPRGDTAEPDDASGRDAKRLAAVERLDRAGHREDPQATKGHPTPPSKPSRSPTVPSLCVLATQFTGHLITHDPSMKYISSLSCLTPELAELLLNHMSSTRLLCPRTLELFFGCSLQKFVLDCYPYSTNELLRQFRGFPNLKHLSLVNSPLITNSGLTVLSNLAKLQYVNLASCSKLTDSCLQHIAGLKSLCFLSLDQTKVSDAGMVQYLQSAPSCLTQLSLNQTAVTEATLSALPRCAPQLRLLSIKKTNVSDVSALAELSSLQTLHLDGTRVTECSLKHLANHPTLSSLSLAGIPVADGNHALEIISGLRLTQLSLPGRHSVTDTGLSFLSRLCQLTELDLTDYIQVTDQGVKLLSAMTRLVRLSLSNTQVTDAGLTALCSLQELQDLCLDRTAVTSRGVAALITRLPQLQVLGLASTRVGDTVARRGLVHCPQMLKLNLSRTRITDHGLEFLKDMYLTQLNLDGSSVTLGGISRLISQSNMADSCIRANHRRTIALSEVSDEEDEVTWSA